MQANGLGQPPGQRHKDGAVGPGQSRSAHLATEHGNLVTQHQGSPRSSTWSCGPAVRARPRAGERSDTAVAVPWRVIMPAGPCPAISLVIAVDDQFGTHTMPTP